MARQAKASQGHWQINALIGHCRFSRMPKNQKSIVSHRPEHPRPHLRQVAGAGGQCFHELSGGAQAGEALLGALHTSL